MRSSLASLLAVLVLAVPPVAGAAECPTDVTFTPAETGSTADTGWTGLGLGRPIYGNTLHLEVGCPSTMPPCGTCVVTGALPDAPGTFQRCTNDTSIQCTVNTEVADCGGADRCRIFITVPQFAVTGGIPSCYTNELTAPPTGTVDDGGALSVTLEYTGTIYSSESFARPCPTCDGDPAPNDGVRSGHCNGGARDGLPCDGHGIPMAGYEEFGTSSFDCPSRPGFLVGTLRAGPLTFATGTQTRTLTAASPRCTGSGGGLLACFCDTCNDAAAEPCASDADCPPSGGNPGVCGGRRCMSGANDGAPCTAASQCPGGLCGRLGEPTKPNACTNDACVDTAPVGDGFGECIDGPVDTTCANHPSRACASDADCDDVAGACQQHTRLCFATDGSVGQSVSATGIATPPVAGVSAPTTLGMIACQAASGSSYVNSILGLPGLARNAHVGTLSFGDAGIPAADCPLAPDACRAPAVLGKSQLQLKDRSPDTKDALKWSSAKAAATTLAELGDPTAGDDYVLCVYDPNGRRMGMRVPAGGNCDGRPCWKTTNGGFAYKRKDGFPHGITQLILRSGSDGKAKLQAAGRGGFLPMPALASIAPPVRVQLRNRTSGLCWEAAYPAPLLKASATDVKARD